MAKPTPQERVNRVLEYLARQQRVAELLHDRSGACDLEHAWLIVMQRFYGRYRVFRGYATPTVAAIPEPRKPKTSEQRIIAKAPLRKITKRVPTYWRDPSRRHRYVVWTEYLDCGHTISSVFYTAKERRPRRRKCRACVPKAAGRILKFPREVSA